LPHRRVQRVHRPVPLGSGVQYVVADFDLHRGLGDDARARSPLNEHQQIDQVERRSIVRPKSTEQELEASFGRLELKPFVLKLFQRIEDSAYVGGVFVEIDAELLGFNENVASSAKLAHQDALSVANELGNDVLVAQAVLEDRVDVQPGLMGERACSDVG